MHLPFTTMWGWLRDTSELTTRFLVTCKMLALRPWTSAKLMLSGFRAVKRAMRCLCHFSLKARAWASDTKLMNAKLRFVCPTELRGR